ncbi:MAG: transposase [Alphaproteobacteria bacterium]|nr:transposase [Alphaproteobacteria bacterium]
MLLRLKTPWADGTEAVRFTPEELVERLAALVPPPRAHLVSYHGVLAGRSAWRSEVVPDPPVTVAAVDESALTPSGRVRRRYYRTWASLLWRVFRVAGWRCPTCGGPMRLRACAMPPATSRILVGLTTSARGPPGVGLFVARAAGGGPVGAGSCASNPRTWTIIRRKRGPDGLRGAARSPTSDCLLPKQGAVGWKRGTPRQQPCYGALEGTMGLKPMAILSFPRLWAGLMCVQ